LLPILGLPLLFEFLEFFIEIRVSLLLS